MPARALLVLLVMLNFGLATWWLLRPGPPPAAAWAPPAGVPPLQLLGEAPPVAATGPASPGGDAGSPPEPTGNAPADGSGPPPQAEPAAVPPPTTASAPPTPPPSTASGVERLQCLSFGPYADATSVASARAAVQPLGAARSRVRDVVDAPRGWRVMMPPQADRAAADALAGRIRAAGFDDLLVVPSGDDANAIALGLYGSEPAARRRESALRTAGFPAQAQPVGKATTRHWLDLAAGPGFDAGAARIAAGAAEARDIDCAGVVAVASR